MLTFTLVVPVAAVVLAVAVVVPVAAVMALRAELRLQGGDFTE